MEQADTETTTNRVRITLRTEPSLKEWYLKRTNGLTTLNEEMTKALVLYRQIQERKDGKTIPY